MRERIEVFWCKDTGLQGEGRQAGREAGRPADEQTDKPCMVTGTCSGDSRHTRGWPKMLGKFWGKHSKVMNVTFIGLIGSTGYGVIFMLIIFQKTSLKLD